MNYDNKLILRSTYANIRFSFSYLFQTIFLLIIILLPFPNIAQDNNFRSNGSLAEKIYLQFDKNVYSTGDTIWFKCIVTIALDNKPSLLSNVLYVELISPTKQIKEKKILKLEKGISRGYFSLDEYFQEGTYLIRAYTLWNRNFGTDFVFNQYINVFAHKTGHVSPISRVELVKSEKSKKLKACFDPLLIDSLHKSNLTVYITTNDKTDSLSIGKGKENKYWLDLNIEDSCRFITLQLQTINNAKSTKTILLDQDYLDIQFFPESGELVHGLPGKVGFKALDVNGKCIEVQGDIVDEKVSVVSAFKSNALGMGSFMLNEVDSSKAYYARLISKTGENQFLLFRLPAVASLGNTLFLEKLEDEILITAASNYMRNDSISLIVSCRGMTFFNRRISMKEGFFRGRIPARPLPEGIIAFTMLDPAGQPVTERLYFNEKPEERLNIELSTDKASYSKREQTKLDIKITNSDGVPVNANLSVLAINKKQLGEIQSKRQNILSYFLLESELKGEIENPGYYFSSDSRKSGDLDALMLTQGWRKYLYSKPYNELPFQPERNLSITGQVMGGPLYMKKKTAKLTMMTFGKGLLAASAMTDSTGRFRFDLDDQYGKNMDVVIQTAKESGKKVDYAIIPDKNVPLPITFNRTSTIDKLDSIVVELVKKDVERKKVDEAFRLSSGTILIQEVNVDGFKMTPERKEVIKMYGKPDVVIGGKELLEKEADWSFGLYNVLMYNYPDDIEILQDTSDFHFYPEVLGSDFTLVIVDGKYDRLSADLVEGIPTSEVRGIDIVKCADNFAQLYLEITGELPNPSWFCGSIIAIYTHSGKGALYAYSPEGITRVSVPIFSTPREFYAPKYKTPNPEERYIHDLRAMLHWQPVLTTNENGTASTSFYNADNGGEMVIVVEAISENGKIGYKELVYKVQGNETKFLLPE